MKKRVFTHLSWRVVLFALLFLFSLYSTYVYLFISQKGYDNTMVLLAIQFLSGHTALSIYGLPMNDVAAYYNNYYVYFGPLGAFLLMPIVFFFKYSTPQVLLGVGSLIVSFITVFFIGKEFKFTPIDRLWLALFFVFSTVLFASGVINITAYQVEALSVPFVLLSLLMYLQKRNPLLIGLLLGLAVMTRFTLVLAIVFFFLEFVQKRLTLRQFVMICIPVAIVLGILGLYNNRRFHSFLETGYNYSVTKDAIPISWNLKYGDFSITHVPANLYSFLIMSPTALEMKDNGGFVLRFPYMKIDPWGLAIWFSSPLFLLLIARFKKGVFSLSAGITALVLSLPVFLWYSIGYAQSGYRYTLDFLPFLFLLLLPCLSPKLSKTAIILITLGVLFNCIYIESIWEIYPVLGILR